MRHLVLIRSFTLAQLAVLAGCATSAARAPDAMCREIERFARADPSGTLKEVTLIRGGAWMVDHYKGCKRSDDEQGAIAFCAWLMENTSTEFMEANINRAISCLQGQRIDGYIGNTGIESWKGKVRFFSPKIDVANVAVTLEYSVQYFEEGADEDFMKITIEPN